jgi:hypothetical protein
MIKCHYWVCPNRTVYSDINEPLVLAFKDPDITINARCYCGTLQDLSTTIERQRPSTFMRGVIMLHDNACPHVACTVRDTLCSTYWKVLDHPPYILDLTPCDFHLFDPLKKVLKGHRF